MPRRTPPVESMPAEQAPTEPTTSDIVTRARSAAEMFRDSLPEAIESRDQYETIGTALARVNRADRQIMEFFRPMKQAAHASWRAICDQENESRELLRNIIARGRGLLDRWAESEADRERQAREAAAVLAESLPADMREFAINTVMPTEMPEVDGVQRRTRTVLEVDLMVLCRAVADGTVPVDCVEANMARINAERRDGRQVPGITEHQVPVTVFR